MDLSNIKSLTIGNFTVKLPIIQGGMGVGVSMSGLAAAVANQGGIGVISAAALGVFEPDFSTNYIEANIRALKKEIRKAREMTKGVLGVNIMGAFSNFADMVRTSIEERIDIIFTGAGLPLTLPTFLKDSNHTKLVPIVSSARAAGIITKRWMDKFKYTPDAFVVEGPLAGGHLGFSAEQIEDPAFKLENLVVQIVNELKPYEEKAGKAIPVIAAGGIYSGQDIHDYLKLGAAGVQMGTRFVATEECDASLAFKEAYVDCNIEDIGIIKSPVGMPGRAITNKFIKDVEADNKSPFSCPYHCIATCDYKKSPYCIALALMNAQKGKLTHGFAFAGANAYKIKKIVSVKELMEELVDEYNSVK